MDRTRKIVGGAVVASLCLASMTSSGESPPVALCQSPQQQMPAMPLTAAQWAEGAQLFDGLGDFHRPVSTNSQMAQSYFDQGMRLLWAFKPRRGDTVVRQGCTARSAMRDVLLGVALTVRPNYNLPMRPTPS